MSNHATLHTISARLDRVFEASKDVDDDEIKAHLARYLCVLTSGYIVESVKIIIRIYVYNKNHPNICNYVNLSKINLSNLKTESLAKFLNSFNNEWMREFEVVMSHEEITAIDSIVANSNEIAHGR